MLLAGDSRTVMVRLTVNAETDAQAAETVRAVLAGEQPIPASFLRAEIWPERI